MLEMLEIRVLRAGVIYTRLAQIAICSGILTVHVIMPYFNRIIILLRTSPCCTRLSGTSLHMMLQHTLGSKFSEVMHRSQQTISSCPIVITDCLHLLVCNIWMTDAIFVGTTPRFLHPFVVLGDEVISNIPSQAGTCFIPMHPNLAYLLLYPMHSKK
jgi:hypothetical protein